VLCEQISITTVADVVDHVVPHKGDMTLFWSEANWQPACKRCHDSRKRVLERGDKMMPHASWNTSGGRSTSGELKPRKPVRISSQ
jgi:5-methylcytosine-specific restriction endonuclease McrA